MSEIVQFPQQVQSTQFDVIADEFKKIFHKPDLEALRIVLCTVAAHLFQPHGYPPTWLMLIGPSGSGKTGLLEVLTRIPIVTRLNDLTPKTFMSGYKMPKGGGKAALLHQLGSSAILVMKDFTTIISMRPENKAEIFSQLREIHDGYYNRGTGMATTHPWTGRLTLITACTNAIDQDRMMFRNMGDRFVEIRWAGPPPKETAQFVCHRLGANDYRKLHELVASYICRPYECPTITAEQIDLITEYACFVAVARTPVFREKGGEEVTSVGTPESPTRLSQCLMSVALSSAALDSSPVVRGSDMALAARVARDSVPPHRRAILEMLTPEGCDPDAETYQAISGYLRRKAIDDLANLNILDCNPHAEFIYSYNNCYKHAGELLFPIS